MNIASGRARTRIFFSSLVAIVSLFAVTGAGLRDAPGPASMLAGRAMGPTPLMEDLRELTDTIGGRITGSEACREAISWAEKKFRKAGVARVSRERFEVPALWLPGTAEVRAISPVAFPVRAVSCPGSPSTPGSSPLQGILVDAGSGSPDDFARLGPSAKGAVALVRSELMETFEDLFAEYLRNSPMLEAARSAGLSSLLLMSTRPRGLLYRHPVDLGAKPSPLPVALISREDGQRLHRLMRQGEVRVGLRLTNETGGPFDSENVVAEIPGRELPDEIVLLGAHLDSWDLGTGANDNGVNSAMVIDVARAMIELGLTARRTIRFVLFTGEEQGMWGSAGYVRDHASEMDRHVAVVIADIGSGRIEGFYLNGRKELKGPVDAALEPVEALGPFTHPVEAVDGTDNFDFMLSGVPNLIAEQEAAPYLPDYHAESDVLDYVDARQARENAAIISALVWGLAEAPRRPAERQSRDEVEKLLGDAGLEAVMRNFGQWDDWVSGRRGAYPAN